MGDIAGVFTQWIFDVIHSLDKAFGDWGLAIIVFTIIFRIIVSPLMHKQSKSSFQMTKLQPKMKAAQEKYKEDPVRMQEETRKIYAEAKVNPLAGCLPLLLQMPIFFALFYVLRNLKDYIMKIEGAVYVDPSFYNLVPSLTKLPSEAYVEGIGIFIPYLILMVVFAGATFLPMMLQQQGKDSPQRKQMLIMGGIMSIVMVVVGWNMPGGVLLFWGASGLIGLAQTQISMSIFRKRDAAEEAAVVDVKPVEVEVVRKAKKPRPTKKG